MHRWRFFKKSVEDLFSSHTANLTQQRQSGEDQEMRSSIIGAFTGEGVPHRPVWETDEPSRHSDIRPHATFDQSGYETEATERAKSGMEDIQSVSPN